MRWFSSKGQKHKEKEDLKLREVQIPHYPTKDIEMAFQPSTTRDSALRLIFQAMTTVQSHPIKFSDSIQQSVAFNQQELDELINLHEMVLSVEEKDGSRMAMMVIERGSKRARLILDKHYRFGAPYAEDRSFGVSITSVLPMEIMAYVLEFLQMDTLGRAERVCKQWFRLINNHEVGGIWRKIYLSEWKLPPFFLDISWKLRVKNQKHISKLALTLGDLFFKLDMVMIDSYMSESWVKNRPKWRQLIKEANTLCQLEYLLKEFKKNLLPPAYSNVDNKWDGWLTSTEPPTTTYLGRALLKAEMNIIWSAVLQEWREARPPWCNLVNSLTNDSRSNSHDY